jgi:hypothetical protein
MLRGYGVDFSIKQSLLPSFEVFCQNIFRVVLLSALAVLFAVFIQGISAFFLSNYFNSFFGMIGFDSLPVGSKAALFFFILFRDTTFLAQTLILLFLTNAFLPTFDGCKVEIEKCYPGIKKIWKFVAGMMTLLVAPTVLSAIAIFFPEQDSLQMVLAAVTIVLTIVLLRYFFFYIEITEGASIIKSFKNSAKATKGNFFPIAFLVVVALLVNLAVFLSAAFLERLTIVFILFTLPMTILILAHVYGQLKRGSSANKSQGRTLSIEDDVMGSAEKESI